VGSAVHPEFIEAARLCRHAAGDRWFADETYVKVAGRSARILAAGHAFVQNLRRGHYELATDVPARHQFRTTFDQLAMAI
jgi:hypothetical protein